MHRITVNSAIYAGIASGIASGFILNENDEFLVNSPILVELEPSENKDMAKGILECSVNSIATDKDHTGLKKGYSLVHVSVIRVIAYDLFLQSK